MLVELLYGDKAQKEASDISKTPHSVKALLQALQAKAKDALVFDERMVDQTAQSCGQFRDSNKTKKDAREKREKELDKWYGMSKKDPEPEEQAELTILRLRKYLEPGKFVNSDGLQKNPKYYEMGTIIDHGFLGKRGPSRRAENTGTIFEELLARDESVGFTKKKFRQIQEERAKTVKNKRYIKLKRMLVKHKSKKERGAAKK